MLSNKRTWIQACQMFLKCDIAFELAIYHEDKAHLEYKPRFSSSIESYRDYGWIISSSMLEAGYCWNLY